jgi:transcriptional regulator with XRE-family HTH domain
MQAYEKINTILKEKKMSVKEFATNLRNLHPSDCEIPSEKSVYAYLNGRIGIKIELIPYIAEILNIPEQILFDDSSRARKNYLRHILNSASNEEIEFIKSKVCEEKMARPMISADKYHKIMDLMVYAPEIFLDEVEKTLKNYKDLTIKFQK